MTSSQQDWTLLHAHPAFGLLPVDRKEDAAAEDSRRRQITQYWRGKDEASYYEIADGFIKALARFFAERSDATFSVTSTAPGDIDDLESEARALRVPTERPDRFQLTGELTSAIVDRLVAYNVEGLVITVGGRARLDLNDDVDLIHVSVTPDEQRSLERVIVEWQRPG